MTKLNIFPQSTHEAWQTLAQTALKGKDFDKTLVTKSLNGFAIHPLYERALSQPLIARPVKTRWGVFARVDYMPNMNAQALADLEGGATGLILVMKGSEGDFSGHGLSNLDGLFEGVIPELIEVRVEGEVIPEPLLTLKFASLTLGLHADSPLLAQALTTNAEKIILIDGRIVHHQGANDAQELGFMLLEGVKALRSLETHGLSLDIARSKLSFLLTAGAEEFTTLAKFRAMRLLWAKVEEASGLMPQPIDLHGETSFMMMTKLDASVNWLRATSAVMGAGLGGADSISVLPHSLPSGVPEGDARRMARNIQHVLLEESNLYQVSDPASGAGGLESLTDELCAAAWQIFQTGLTKEAIAIVAKTRAKAIATRKYPLTGTSEFPQLLALSTEVLTAYAQDNHIKRYAQPFEKLREKSGEIHLITLGTLAEYTPRLSFAQNLFAAGGVSAKIGEVESFVSGIACLCGTDAGYETQGQAIIAQLKKAGAKAIFIAGKTALNEVDVAIYAGCDVIETLETFYKVDSK